MDYAKIREFYNQLEDEESRLIFRSRLNYLFTGDRTHLYEMTENANRLFHPAKVVRNIKQLLSNPNEYSSGAVIYSVGEASGVCLESLENANIKVHAFCDMGYDKWRAEGYLGLPVVSPEELISDPKYKQYAIVMSNAVWQKENSDFLIANEFSTDNIFVIEGRYNYTNYVYQGSYFQQDFFEPVSKEVYIDAGCFDGDTIKQFDEFCSGSYSKIIGFEPHPVSYQNTLNNIKEWGLRDVEIIPKGAWSSDGEFSFILEYGSGAGGARIMNGGGVTAQTTTIDKIVGEEPVTFIKMDIEGAELEALKGAKEAILRCKPRLAICIYHKPEDIVEIPLFLYETVPDYKFYIRHHNSIRDIGNVSHETVLYAVYPNKRGERVL